MRVALLTNFVPPYRVSLYEALAREVGELRVFLSTRMERTRAWPAEWGELDVVVQKSLSLRRTWRTTDFSESYELHVPYDTVAQLRRFKPDVVLTSELGARSLQALWYGRRADTPCVLWATLSDRTEATRGRLRRALRQFMVPRFDAAIVNGEAGARYLRQLGRADADLLRVPYTTDMRRLLELPLAQRGRRLLYVGSLTERKGLRLLLEACAGLPLTIVGDGPLRAELETHSNDVEWAGNVPYEELPHWYGRAGLFIFPSLADEWGVVVNEALAAGLPVIGSTHSQAVEELVREAENGWLFAPDSAAAVRAAIDRALAVSDEQLARMRVAARDTASKLDPNAAAAQIARLLKRL